MVKIFYNYKNSIDTLELKEKIKLRDLLNKLNINSEEVIVKKNNKILTEEDEIKNDDEIKIFKVVSGG